MVCCANIHFSLFNFYGKMTFYICLTGMGQHIGMTDLDVQRLNAMYECSARNEK